MNLSTAKALQPNQIVYHRTARDSKGHPSRLKITSVKTWKRDPERVKVTAKYGLYEHYVYTNESGLTSIANICLTAEEAAGNAKEA